MIRGSKKVEPQNCWEFIKCPEELRKKCEAYKKKIGIICWFINEDDKEVFYSSQKYDGCINCPWYKKLNPE